ncbi:MAG: hypothetical protein WKF50_08335 [Nocardioides sp.]
MSGLSGEARWAREQAVEATRDAEQLADPAWVRRRITQLHRDQRALLRTMEDWLRLRDESSVLEDDESREALRRRHLADAATWTHLAEGHEARIGDAQ